MQPTFTASQYRALSVLGCGHTSSTKCYGCASAVTEHCITLLRALATNAAIRHILVSQGLIRELFDYNLRRGAASMREEVRQLMCLLTRLGSLTALVYTSRVETGLATRVSLSSGSPAAWCKVGASDTLTVQAGRVLCIFAAVATQPEGKTSDCLHRERKGAVLALKIPIHWSVSWSEGGRAQALCA